MIPVWGFLFAGISSAATSDRIAAVVNDDVITLSEVYELGAEFISEAALTPDARREAEINVLDSLVLRSLVSQELMRLEFDVTEDELTGAIDEVAANNGMDLEQLRNEIENSGLTWALYQTQLKESLRQMKFNQTILQPRIQVEEDGLLDLYQRKVRAMDSVMEAEIGAVFLKGSPGFRDAKSIAKESDMSIEEAQAMIDEAKGKHRKAQVQKLAAIQEQLEAGAKFEDIASAFDEGGFNKNEGRMGIFPEGQLRGDLDAAAFATPVGSLSEPIETDQGLFLIYVYDRRPQAAPPFEDMRSALLDEYYEARFERETEVWFTQAKRRAHIEIMLEEPKGP